MLGVARTMLVRGEPAYISSPVDRLALLAEAAGISPREAAAGLPPAGQRPARASPLGGCPGRRPRESGVGGCGGREAVPAVVGRHVRHGGGGVPRGRVRGLGKSCCRLVRPRGGLQGPGAGAGAWWRAWMVCTSHSVHGRQTVNGSWTAPWQAGPSQATGSPSWRHSRHTHCPARGLRGHVPGRHPRLPPLRVGWAVAVGGTARVRSCRRRRASRPSARAAGPSSCRTR